MEPTVNETDGHAEVPSDSDVRGPSVVDAEWWDEAYRLADAVTNMTNSELVADAAVEPVVSTTEAAEYFDRTSQWIYWGLKPDPDTGEIRFVWPDGTPIAPERVGDNQRGRRRFTMAILRGILQACYRRGNIGQDELTTIIRRIRYTEAGVEWREKEGWKYANLGRNRHRWVKPDKAYWDEDTHTWKLIK